MSVRIICHGGPLDGRERSAQIALETLRFPTPDLTLAAMLRPYEDPRNDPSRSGVTMYHRAAQDADGVWHYYHDHRAVAPLRGSAVELLWLGEHRYRTKEPTPYIIGAHLYVFILVAPDLEKVYTSLVEPDEIEQCIGSYTQEVFQELEEHADYERRPHCAVPNCHEKANRVATACRGGRLAGKHWIVGDEIPLCLRHATDIHRVIPGGDPHLPPWLAADAEYPYWCNGGHIIPVTLRAWGQTEGGIDCGGIGNALRW